MSIIPVRDKKRFITLPSYKIKDINVSPTNILMSRSTRDYSNISKTIEELRKEILEKDKRIINLEGELSGNTLKQKYEHVNIQLSKYRIYCFKTIGDIQMIRCISMRAQNKCSNKCKSIEDFIKKLN